MGPSDPFEACKTASGLQYLKDITGPNVLQDIGSLYSSLSCYLEDCPKLKKPMKTPHPDFKVHWWWQMVNDNVDILPKSSAIPQSENMNCLGHRGGEKLRQRLRVATEETVGSIQTIKGKSLGGGDLTWRLQHLTDMVRFTPEWKQVGKGGLMVLPVAEEPANDIDRDVMTSLDGLTLSKGLKQADPYPPNYRKDSISIADLTTKLGIGFGAALFGFPIARASKSLSELDTKPSQIRLNDMKGKKGPTVKAMKNTKSAAPLSWRDTRAETAMKSFEKLVRPLKIPSLLARSIDYNGDFISDLGLDVPKRGGKIDLLLAFVAGNELKVVLCKINRDGVKSWKEKEKEPTKRVIEQTLRHLEADIDMIRSLLPDIAGSNLIFSTFSCFPDIPVAELSNIFCMDCMDAVLGKEDLDDQDRLSTKLTISTAPWDEQGLENLLKLSTRLLFLMRNSVPAPLNVVRTEKRKYDDPFGKLQAAQYDSNLVETRPPEDEQEGELMIIKGEGSGAPNLAERRGVVPRFR